MMHQNWQAAFEVFDRENPHFFQQFKKIAERHRRNGLGYITAALIFEEIRCLSKTTTTTDQAMPPELQGIQVNNNYRSSCVRKLLAEDNTFTPFFRIRERKWSMAAVA